MANNSESIEQEKYITVGNVKVEIDVSNALKCLKAVQREAKKAASALRDVEHLSDKQLIESLTDDEIFKVLSSRGWDIDTADLKDEWGLPVQSSVTMYKNHKTH